MDEALVSARDLAAELSVSYQAVKKVVDGKSAAFSVANNAYAARVLKVTSDWLATGEGPMRAPCSTWPFPSIDERAVLSLSHDDLVRLDAAGLFAAAQLGLEVKVSKSKSAAA